MKTQVTNPFLPTDIYMGNPSVHVFGDKAYLFGALDEENGSSLATHLIEVFSSPKDNLSEWTTRGVSYDCSQDPLFNEGKTCISSCECVQGNNGRYYLYYILCSEDEKDIYKGIISVAVSSFPDGRYEYLGYVRNQDGSPFNEGVIHDPSLLNDKGVIRMYYGLYLPLFEKGKLKNKYKKWMINHLGKTEEKLKEKNYDIMGPHTVLLDNDMLTVKSEPKRLYDVYTSSPELKGELVSSKDGHNFKGHAFKEGSSIRKIKNNYYFIYTSLNEHELCYLVSTSPDKEFKYGGTVISLGDIGLASRPENERLNYTSLNHGCIEVINGKLYVFYHRHTHKSDYSRQVMGEQIRIDADGIIYQGQVTSNGLNGQDLEGSGFYSSSICANLTNPKMVHGKDALKKANIPYITTENGLQIIKNMNKGTKIIYKYFDFTKTYYLSLELRGKGIIEVYENGNKLCEEKIASYNFEPLNIRMVKEKHATLEIKVTSGVLDFFTFTLR